MKINTDRYGRLVPVTEGTWERDGRGRYVHVSGIAVERKSYGWEIVGGPEDGYHYTTLTIAQASALRHFTRAA